jgi:hypothetical protein
LESCAIPYEGEDWLFDFWKKIRKKQESTIKRKKVIGL